jgi:CO/xanthine dehydrogenase Mo-binding subunit
VPVHADVPDITTILFEEQDRVINPAGVKGLGELPIVGAAAAIARLFTTRPGCACAICRSVSRSF